MNRWSGGVLRIVFAFVIVLLAAVVSISVSAIFHSQRNLITGITFLAAVVSLVLFFEKVFPSLYFGLRRGPRPWWQWRGSFSIAFAIIVSILSSRIATLWFGLLIVSGVLVALLLRVTRRDGEL
jgi:MFS family permease